MPWIVQISLDPGKNDHFTLRIQRERTHVQKRYLLWPLTDVLGILNVTGSESDGETFPSKFDKLLTFSLFYMFIKARKQYIYDNKILQNTCLHEICENTSLLGKGLNNAYKSNNVPFDPHSIVEKYSCDSESRECMLNSCDECKHHRLTMDDVETNEDNSDSDSETNMVRYYQWKRGDNGYLTNLMVEADADEALVLWQSMVETLKEHIHYKRRQSKEIRRVTVSLTMEEILINLDYSENYKSKHQN